MFDDYALPANYGEPEPPSKQKAPERPRMRVVPNADEMPTPTHVEAYGSLGVPRMSGYGAASSLVTLPMVKTTSSAADVKYLQSVLKGKDYNLGTTGQFKDGVDGDWGSLTSAAVRDQQRRFGLPQNGDYVDATLWNKMLGMSEAAPAASEPQRTTGVDVATSGVLGLLQGLTGQTQPATTFQPSAASDTSSVSNGGAKDDDNKDAGTNWMPWVLAGVGVLAIGGIIYAVSRQSSKDEE